MNKPVIGINCNNELGKGKMFYRLDSRYGDAIQAAGGIPFLFPNVRDEAEAKEILGRVDGVLFTGGADIDPSRWNEKKHPRARLLPPDKEQSDFLFAKAALARKLPVLAICYGHQLINVLRGGTLHQHIPDIDGQHIPHSNSDGNLMHPVRLDAGTQVRDIMGCANVEVNSSHHQAVNRLGDKIRPTAWAEDGIMEALEETSHRFLIGVQWHPERTAKMKPHRRLFEALVNEARRS